MHAGALEALAGGSMPLPWLLASQANPGSQPSSWSVQLFQEAPREGEGPVTMSISAFSS